MKISILSLLATFHLSLAFHVVPERRTTTRLSVKNEDIKTTSPFLPGPFSDVEPDVDRAKDCADHFGKCSIKEMEKLKHGRLERLDVLFLVNLNYFSHANPFRFLFQNCTISELKAWSFELLMLRQRLP
jgi:hypothetical protein